MDVDAHTHDWRPWSPAYFPWTDLDLDIEPQRPTDEACCYSRSRYFYEIFMVWCPTHGGWSWRARLYDGTPVTEDVECIAKASGRSGPFDELSDVIEHLTDELYPNPRDHY